MINDKVSNFLKQQFHFSDQSLEALESQEHIQKKVKDLLVLFTNNKDSDTRSFIAQQMASIQSTLTPPLPKSTSILQKEREKYYTFI